jgi:hypothetical protein
MISVPVTHADCLEAWNEADRIGILKNSVMGKAGSFVGIIGEWAVMRHLAALSPVRENTYEHDIHVAGKRVDVKSKRWAGKPPHDAPVNVSEYSRQDCDAYIFTHVIWGGEEKRPTEVLIAGWIKRDEFINNSTLWRRGEAKPCGWICSKDCREMPSTGLEPMSTFGGWCESERHELGWWE